MPRYYGRRRRPMRFRRRGRAGRGGAWRRFGAKAGSLAYAAWRGVQKIRGLVNSELFKFDSTFTASNITQETPLVQPLHGIAQGDGDNARTGNSIYCRAWNLKGILYRSTSGDQSQQVRFSVVMDTQQVGDTAPAYTDIYEQALPWAHLNSNTVGRFKILWTRTYTLDVVKSLSVPININIPMRHHVRYNGVNGTDVQKGGLYLCAVSSQGSANYPILTGEYRLSYHDN